MKNPKNRHHDHHIRSNALRASSPALRTDVLVIVPVAVSALPLPPAATLPAAFALFAAAATRKRLAPLGRFNRVIVAEPPLLALAPRDTISTFIPIAMPTPPSPRSRSKRRRNGLGRFSSSFRSYFGVAGGAHDIVSSGVTVPQVPEDEEEDDDDDDDDDTDDEEEEGGAVPVAVIVASWSGVFVAVASTRFA